MSVLNQLSDDENPECPLCMELLELDDISFYPCQCGYQICRFCWNKIRTEGNGLCPACRSPYSENPADFKPLTTEELARIKAEKRQRSQAKKQMISENRKHLANVRVVQKNLVFVVGLSPRLSDQDVLRRPEYFGKFGKIHKVVINHSTSYAGNQNQGPSASAYVTYIKSEDALRAIQAVNNIFIDGRTLKASLGTTKYCSHFMKNQQCPKHDCMYLHELGDEAASFTKEEMQQGKHTDYERQLHEEIMPSATTGCGPTPSSAGTCGTPPSSASPPTVPSPALGAGEKTPPAPAPTPPTKKGRKKKSRSISPTKNQDSRAQPPQVNGIGGRDESDEDARTEEEMGLNGLSRSVPHQKNEAGGNAEEPQTSTSRERRARGGRNAKSAKDRKDIAKAPLVVSSTPPTLSPSSSPVSTPAVATEPPSPPPQLAATSEPPVSQLKTSSKSYLALDDDDDDLGFDPFAETQKALAEMLETETRQQQQQHTLQRQHLHRETSNPLLSQLPLANGGDRPFSFMHAHQTQQAQSLSRPKAPPPGFNMTSGGNGQSGLPRFAGNALDGPLASHGHALGHNLPFSAHQQQTSSDMLARMGKASPPPPSLLGSSAYSGGGHHAGWPSGTGSGKDWQDSLRALLPNANVSFGNLPTSGAGGGGGPFRAEGRGNGLDSRPFQRDEQQWSSNNHDLSLLDPAIVGGQLSNSHLGAQQLQRNNGWLKDTLSMDSGSSAIKTPLPTFSGLSLGGAGLSQPPSHQRWGGGELGFGVAGSGAPPPGFGGRSGLGGLPNSGGNGGSLLPQHPFSSLGVNGGSDGSLLGIGRGGDAKKDRGGAAPFLF